MSLNAFVANFANAVEVDAAGVNAESVFKNLASWDSLCALSVIAMVDDAYQVTIGGDELDTTDTIGDLWSLISTRH
ncbi:MAG TPA: acyl carrier protein [Burkholderiales bacterium]|jgi:acyl carrier protein